MTKTNCTLTLSDHHNTALNNAAQDDGLTLDQYIRRCVLRDLRRRDAIWRSFHKPKRGADDAPRQSNSS